MRQTAYSSVATLDVNVPEGSSEDETPRIFKLASRRTVAAVGVSLLALFAVALLASSSSGSSAALSEKSETYNGANLRTQLDGEEAAAPAAAADAPAAEAAAAPAEIETADKILPAGLKGFVPHMDKVQFPTSWRAIRKTFGMHLDWAFFIVFLGVLTWGYVRYVRPKMAKPAEGEEHMVLDENDVIASLHLGPGEELYFIDCETGKEGNIGFAEWFGASNRVSKLAVTSRRVVAQFREATFCGTCQVATPSLIDNTWKFVDTSSQLGAKEECWPVENVSKVSVISGEFHGLTIPQLWSTAYTYFFICLLFDLFGGFVKDNIQDFFGAAAQDEVVAKIIWGINLSIGIICNLLFILAVIYAFAVMWMVIFPTSIIKVYLTSKMEENGHPLNNCSGYCCNGSANSRPMESFTFATRNSYKSYQAIMSARSGAGNPFSQSSV